MMSNEDSIALVTGGAGFIGSNIVDRLMNDGLVVRVVDNLSNGKIDNLSKWRNHRKFEFIKGDIRNSKVIRKCIPDVSVIYHQAAKVSVPASISDPHSTIDVNVMGTTNILDEARKHDVEKIVVASSSSVYGDTSILPKAETMHTLPLSPYAASKLAEERISIAFYHSYGIKTTALRYFNVYGPRQRGGQYAGVISEFVRSAVINAPLSIHGDGEQTRDFTFVSDVVEANILAANSEKSQGQIYNVGTGIRTSINLLADEIIKFLNSKSIKEKTQPRIGDVKDSLADLNKITSDLRYKPNFNLNKGLEITIQWMMQDKPEK